MFGDKEVTAVADSRTEVCLVFDRKCEDLIAAGLSNLEVTIEGAI